MRLFPGKADDCPPGQAATCDRVMMAGETIFYLAWIATWLAVAVALHPKCHGTRELLANWLAPYHRPASHIRSHRRGRTTTEDTHLDFMSAGFL